MSNIVKAFFIASAVGIGLSALIATIFVITFYLPLIWSVSILVMCMLIFVWLTIYLGLEITCNKKARNLNRLRA